MSDRHICGLPLMDHIELTERSSGSGFRLLSSSHGAASKSGFVSFMDEAKESPDQPPPSRPERLDGGLKAWLQVLGSFCLFFTSWYYMGLGKTSVTASLTVCIGAL